jgi:BRCA1-associated protein
VIDRLDAETSGVITTMCNHTFHCDCLAKWSDGTCPVCRYSQGQQESVCTTCGSKENLWVCLICGHVGCGRYSGGHANAHYKATNHTYALELESQRVWDYTGDGYVHRLIANKQDGKLIELDKSGLNKDQQEMLEAQYQSKLDYLFKEYNTLLAEQLEKQRVHFETKIMTIEKEKDAQIENLVSELKMYREERQKVAKLSEKYQKKFEKQEEDIKLLRQVTCSIKFSFF